MKIKTNETDKPTPSTLHALIETEKGMNTICIDICGQPKWVEQVREALAEFVKKMK